MCVCVGGGGGGGGGNNRCVCWEEGVLRDAVCVWRDAVCVAGANSALGVDKTVLPKMIVSKTFFLTGSSVPG